MARLAGGLLVAALVAFAAAQLVPYGRAHTNPPVRQEPAWPDPQARALAQRACFDCHSNQTVWPWYASVAPLSWVLQRHVDEGRQRLNFSEWDRPQRQAREAAETLRAGEMPTADYLVLHPEARLSAADQQALATSLQALAGQPEATGGGEGVRGGRGRD